jgi:hypothetical protein
VEKIACPPRERLNEAQAQLLREHDEIHIGIRLQLARADQRKISESASVSGLCHVDELLVRAYLVGMQHLRVRTSFQHRANAAESILPHASIAHVEEDRLIVLDLGALDVVGIDAQTR